MPQSLAVTFAGTPAFAVPALDAIAASHHRLVAVCCQPDRPAGRGRRVAAGPVKERAQSLGLPVLQPKTLRDPAAVAALAAHPADVMVVVAYGLLLPPAVLALPRLGCLNIHASLLPRWRGAAPVQHAILAGDPTTGVCIMRMEEGLDTGPVMLREEVAIRTDETAGELQARLATTGATLIARALDELATGRARFEPQDPALATHAGKLSKAMATIDWREPAERIARQVRALNPWPVAETRLDGRQLRVWEAGVAAGDGRPGQVLGAGDDGLVVATGAGALAIRRLQLPGGKPVPAADFARSRELAGLVLG